ncbi:MAG TPA: tRNA preQ1(34) S-adenosylmethionine ribosyltransferase-isomerase QueA [Povalibacter sp.]|uniref:tRNA preQ1(34) S-adenosylmethionine ribosyltransferase-isomerase QueA n=1 Tax=Povalibacter sp. TaxID=1962978 RepID=UPI002CB6BB5A|nr:tRNA preQ1(34) S-adenosylmethionine ribosyltransferase-isomerase QueA [Povalibacter sp.]HMN43216.1 tRNA preQ1(34) S-adenosylmethionine ribosyltransferase-isomerase QueA [Povalibacter sp.]
MRRADFAYDLPAELIAQRPPAQRSGSRLLRLARDARCEDLQFTDFPGLLRANDLLIFNDTRVIPARVFGVKPTGGQVEILLERILDGRRILAHVHASKALRAEVPVLLQDGAEARFVARRDDLFELELNVDPLGFFERHGSMPLPPYIERSTEADDATRYQTIYARESGAVAAPTAGLHFDDAIVARCAEVGARAAYVTLHVGAGTFQPIRVDDLDRHKMHRERVQVSEEVCEAVARARADGGRVIAVGTTVVRSLESAAQGGSLLPFSGETQLFIRPGYRFNAVDALLTNFHLPESTLLMLVCAFGGYDAVMNAYRHAVAQRYRFFSYGDAMFLERAA